MKKIILLTVLLFATVQFTFSQNTIAKLKFEEAEELFTNEKYWDVVTKLEEVETILKSTNPKILHLKILAQSKKLGEIPYDCSNLPIGYTFLNVLIQSYLDYPNQSEWNHNLMTGLNYNNIIVQNLIEVYPLINDSSNSYLNNINSDPINTFGSFNLNDAFQYLSWRGLEQTQNYINLIQNVPSELNKRNYIDNSANNKFTNTCNY